MLGSTRRKVMRALSPVGNMTCLVKLTQSLHTAKGAHRLYSLHTANYRPSSFSNSKSSLICMIMSSHRCMSRIVYNTKTNDRVVPSFLKAEEFFERTAIQDQNGKYKYGEILVDSTQLSKTLLDMFDEKDDLGEKRVAFLCPNDVSYLKCLWSIWMAGGVALPLHPSHPVSEYEYFLQDSKCSIVVTTEEYSEKVKPLAELLNIPHLVVGKDNKWGDTAEHVYSTDLSLKNGRRRVKNRYDDLLASNKFRNKRALIIYTSGTTGRPKGVVYTYGNLHAMMTGMVSSWNWLPSDVILHTLPLHHVHGIVNVLLTPLYVGATCVILPKFDARKVWSMLLNPISADGSSRITLFMAVPTIYAKLIEEYDNHLTRGRGGQRRKEYVKSVCSSRIRLMVSGSAALPEPIMRRWEEITGHRLLERYGMTETGMVLTNPLNGPRIPGAVGTPFPGVDVCIAHSNVYAEHGYDIIAQGNQHKTTVTSRFSDTEGELYVRGPNVFKEYFNKPEETKKTFTTDGWFKTGDTACYQDGVYRILGRTSVDIIKSGGYKISALDIERHLLSHFNIKEVAVVALPDITWGQKVAAVIVTNDSEPLLLSSLRAWCQDKMPSYHIPSEIKCVGSLPRNAMGKINKKELVVQVFGDRSKQR